MLIVRPFQEADAPSWDALVARSRNGTFLHTRRFLAYHGARFVDRSVVVHDEGRLLGVLPAATDPGDPGVVVSHPGAGYGGLVHAGELGAEGVIAALDHARAIYGGLGHRELRYKATPAIYHRIPAGEDLYALHRLGASRYRCDLSATIDLASQPPYNRGRRSNIGRARRLGVETVAGTEHLEAFWPVLEGNLAARHGARPVHTLGEIRLLATLFPAEVDFVGAAFAGRLVAGTVLFRSPNVDHAQYIAADAEGFRLRALDHVFDTCARRARARGARWFDFGISTEREGRVLNAGLHRFKMGFGAGAVACEFYALPLDGPR